MITLMLQLQEITALSVAPGLCGACKHAAVNSTHRGTTYLRCTRADWDASMTRYPALPVTNCVGFEPDDPGPPGEPQVPMQREP